MRIRSSSCLISVVLTIALVTTLLSAVGANAGWDGGHDIIGSTGASRTWYFAEGCTRPGFSEWLCLMNPGDHATEATISYMLETGRTISTSHDLAAHSRTTVDVGAEVGAGHDVSVKVTSGDPVVAERPMYFNYHGTWTGGHDVLGAGAPARRWYFAEGTCRPGFESFICLQNPGGSDAEVEITYMLGSGSSKKQSLAVGKHSRSTVAIRDALGQADDAAHDFSARVESTNRIPVVAERPMYFAYRGVWTGGHDVLGATAPGTAFYFAEGTCRPNFDPYICIMNPGSKNARVRITYMLGDGTVRKQELAVRGGTRSTVAVKGQLGEADDTAHDFSAKVETNNGTSIVAERPVYFAYGGAWTGGHDVVGASKPAVKYYFAEGTCRPGFEPYICVQNPGSGAALVKVTYFLGDGTSKEQEVEVSGRSRVTLVVKETLGEGDDAAHDFSASIESTSATPIVAERPVYFSYLPNIAWSLSAVGDVNLGGDMVPILTGNGFAYPWTLVGDLLRSTTLTFANLECAISNRGEQIPGKAFTFRGPPDGLAPMWDAGVDVVSQANNHARDFGALALTDSLGYLDQFGIAHCGAGADFTSAHAPAMVDANGLRVAFLAYNDISYDGWPGWQAGPGYPGIADAANTAQITADIRAARAGADLVVAAFHWGTERKYTPDPRQIDLAHLAVDSGADLVLGGHPHVIQGVEFYRGKPVFYSLGNFVFSPGSDQGHYTMLAQFEMDSRGFRSAKIYPVYIANGRPQLMTGGEAASLLSQLAGLSAGLGTTITVANGVATIP